MLCAGYEWGVTECRVWRYHKWALRAGQARLACALTLKLSRHKWLFGNIDKWRPGATSTAPLYCLARANLSLSCVNITAVSLSLFNLGKFCFRGSLVGVWKRYIPWKEVTIQPNATDKLLIQHWVHHCAVSNKQAPPGHGSDWMPS